MSILQLFDNNATTVVGAQLLVAGTTLTVATGEGVKFSPVVGNETMVLTLENSGGDIEIVLVTAHTAAADTFTITRAQEGTTAIQWEIGEKVEQRITAGFMNDGVVKVDNTFTTTLGFKALNIQSGPTASINAATGSNAVAIGYNALASSAETIAIGRGVEASSSNAVAMGDGATASGSDSVSIGGSSSAVSSRSVCIGKGGASGGDSICIGAGAAIGTEAIAIGNEGIYGQGTKATATRCIAIGGFAEATVDASVAVGGYARTDQSQTVAIGAGTRGQSIRATALGSYARVQGTADRSTALGSRCQVYSGSNNGVAVGYGAKIRQSATYATVLGSYGFTTVSNSTMIMNPTVISDPVWNSGTTAILRTKYFSASSSVIATEEVDFLALSNTDILLPTNFYLEEVGVICTKFNTLTTQPTVSFGTTSGGVDIKASAITTGLTAINVRERFTSPLLDTTGHTGTLFANVDVVAVATELKGRFYFKGFFIETT